MINFTAIRMVNGQRSSTWVRVPAFPFAWHWCTRTWFLASCKNPIRIITTGGDGYIDSARGSPHYNRAVRVCEPTRIAMSVGVRDNVKDLLMLARCRNDV
ncbi:hypothetical protein HBH70_029270 [Parastagonospora nodorum]|nr:hypothetical protein HBH51_026880 [Parastagonospora nodorum]KAH4036792.1 hypothetical protein HBI09_077480 [Parastagonospora nodorum]KAH4252278.1 hypothetical protein HBI03_211410 [Parastagonospora nodorum]KAH4259254.1 hypothetical protein HBI04_214690 [Parastagonospora nodorum]KAH4288030.1 hypothetical protein HBI01_224580 [Parastagonospora nodorum]